MNQILREENKFHITMLESEKFKSYFSKILAQDLHNVAMGYPVRSLYFDSLNDNDFNEKQDGIEVRKKMRLRIYDPQDDFAMLEMKQKQGNKQKKRSLKIAKKDAQMLCQSQYSPLLNYDHPFAAECYALLNVEFYRPKTIIEYNRFAFVGKENKIRITFDSDIRCTESSFDLFSDHLLMSPVFEDSHVVLEIKYNGFLPSYIKDIVSVVDRSKISVSKYCLGRSTSKKYIV